MIISDHIRHIIDQRLTAYLSDLEALVAMDSYSDDRDDVNVVNNWLENRLLDMGFWVQRHPQSIHGDNLTATLNGAGCGRVLLLGHSDTVFPRGTAAARPLTRSGDKILGPGTYDMKAGLLTGIYAAAALQAMGYREFGQIGFLIVSDEETDQRESIPLIQSTVRGYDAVLTLEGARENGDIVTARKGTLWVSVTAHGKAAHAGVEPEKGRNAIMALTRKLEEIVVLADPSRDVTVNVGVIRGGIQPNVVPDQASAQIDVRAFEPAILAELKQKIAALCATETADGVRFSVEQEENSPPMARTAAIARLESLAMQAADEIGFAVRGAKTGGAADAAFAAAEGVPALDGLGPVGGLDHSPDEYIEYSSIVPRTAMLARLITLITEESS